MISLLRKLACIALCSILLAQKCTALTYPSILLKGSAILHPHSRVVTLSPSSRFHTLSLFSAAEEPSTEKEMVKLPILQIVRGSEITGEFICGNDLQNSVDKFLATLTSVEKQITDDPSFKSGNYGVRNIYSEGQLETESATLENYVIIKLFREGCKKCALLAPVIDDLSRDPLYSKFIFLQADVANVEKYTANLKERLLGIRGGGVENCATCENSGFIPCSVCEGKGYVRKGELAAFCPACSGYKKIRCTTCGGKCFKCA